MRPEALCRTQLRPVIEFLKKELILTEKALHLINYGRDRVTFAHVVEETVHTLRKLSFEEFNNGINTLLSLLIVKIEDRGQFFF